MSIVEATETYEKMLKRGIKEYKACVLRGLYPYPLVLDEILHDGLIHGRMDLGVMEIPMEDVVGTKSSGRKNSFSTGFYPLLDKNSEFASKWIRLCDALSNEGQRDPVRCYEYLGRFYVQEGNKRVSVMKCFDAPSISAYVIRMIPEWSDDPEIVAYYEFLSAYEKTGMYEVRFSRAGGFARLQAILGYDLDHVWTEEERKSFFSGYLRFHSHFMKHFPGRNRNITNTSSAANSVSITVADALLVWLKDYSFDSLKSLSDSELEATVEKIRKDVELLKKENPISLRTENEETQFSQNALGQNLFSQNILGQNPFSQSSLSRFWNNIFPSKLKIAFVSDLTPEESDWVRGHDNGRRFLEETMSSRIEVLTYYGARPSSAAAEEAMEDAAANGAEVIFAVTPSLVGVCRKEAKKHEKVHFLNCSASMPYSDVRTYYSRIYEAKFITGAIAGALSRNGRIGYVASYPIFGVPASINAFALGAQMTNPDAIISLRWSCLEEDAFYRLAAEGNSLVSNRDVPSPDRLEEPWGLCRRGSDGRLSCLAAPYWNWGNFYVKLVRNILNGGWEVLNARNSQAVNYWWGMQSQVVEVLLHEGLSPGISALSSLLSSNIADGSFLPFHRLIYSQDGKERNNGEQWFSPMEILHMDWLCDNVEGSIPEYNALLPMAKPLVRLLGLQRETIPPEKGDSIL